MFTLAEEARAVLGALSLEECLSHFDEKLLMCNEYFREKAERQMKEAALGGGGGNNSTRRFAQVASAHHKDSNASLAKFQSSFTPPQSVLRGLGERTESQVE
jgi:hypothetical protein